ncbi:hypothetical protein, partial [Streptomyces sp. SM14]|uniref:hypothetical protein n=1 Tax=Streptomyces sp. SM14 TaxID=1736045 RepID=UPI0011B048B7
MTNGSPAPADGGTGPGGKAEELMAAVRAVEKGERSATEFFTRPVPPPAPSRTAPAPSGPANGTPAPA